MITIEQLLESVDLGFEPRWVTKDENGVVELWETEPRKVANGCWCNSGWRTSLAMLKLAEFDGKDWTECIYEVPRKTTGKIEKIKCFGTLSDYTFKPSEKFEPMTFMELIQKINELVGAVNELKAKDSK